MPWKPGAEVWHYTVAAERYEPLLLGRVLFVGEVGFTVTLAEPDAFGGRELKLEFGCPNIWESEAEARAWCEAHGGPRSHLRRD